MKPKTFKYAKKYSLLLFTAGALAASTSHVSAQPESQYHVYGHAMVDVIADFGRVAPDYKDTSRPSRIPVQNPQQYGSDGEFMVSIRQSRLGLKGETQTAMGTVKTKMEWDYFAGTSDNPQLLLRYFFGELGRWGAGQANTVFMDAGLLPNTIDYWGPNGMIFIRKPMVRYHAVASEHQNAYIALEDSGTDIDTNTAGFTAKSTAPDLTANYKFSGGWGHLQFAGIVRRLEAEIIGTNTSDSTYGYGLNTTSVLHFGNDRLRLGVVVGEGIAANFNDGGSSLAQSGADKIEAVPSLGITAYYDRSWNKNWSSALGFSINQQDNTEGQADDAFKKGTLAQVNLLYTAGRLMNGVEIIWSEREDKNQKTNDDSRIQYSMKYSFDHIF